MMDNKTKLKIHYFFAWCLCNLGVWVHNRGYHWKNVIKTPKYWYCSGRYQAYGEYPGNIRACYRHKLSGFKYHAKFSSWYIYFNPNDDKVNDDGS